MLFCRVAGLAALLLAAEAAPEPRNRRCRSLPGDRNWPSIREWDTLNRTVGGRLIQGIPLAHVCYGPKADAAACASLDERWNLVNPFLNDPVNGVSPYWANNSCTPTLTASSDPSLCQLGNAPYYAINVTDAKTAAAGIKFARDKNVRLVVKNTGHDYLGGSVGRGSLALWTHNLKDIAFIDNYRSQHYKGPAVKIGAGVQFNELYAVASPRGLRIVGGSCPTVGANGGWRQGGGHGPLSSAHGLGADNTLEFEVVTANGKHLTASPKENADLFYALAGGGAGNYAVVISAVVKAHKDGQFAGSRLTINNNDDKTYWTAIEEWFKHVLHLDTIPGFATEVLITRFSFSLVMATLPGGDEAAMTRALSPFYKTLGKLNIKPVVNETKIQKNYLEHYDEYLGGTVFTRNITIGGRLIPRSLVRNQSRLSALTSVYKDILADDDTVLFLLGYNVTNRAAGVPQGYNAVTDAWRDSLWLTNVVIAGDKSDDWAEMSRDMERANRWQDKLRALTPGGGAYINEGTYNAPQWKDDYFGGTYNRLRSIKAKYDPNFVLYTRPGVGADEYAETADGHLCKV